MSKLNEAQRKAAAFGEGPLLVLAGPGSGKTFTITQRIFYLIFEKKVPPENILVITFTQEAAKSMQERFLKLCDQIYPVNFGTFHSLFYHILREAKVISHQALLSDRQKINLFVPILRKFYQEKLSDMQLSDKGSNERLQEEAPQILAAFGFLKNTGDKEAAAAHTAPVWQPYFEELFQTYEKAVKSAGAIDFDDMLYECLKLLKQNRKVRTYWQNRFSHILIDEFQDINPVQYETVKLLLKPPYNIFAVGDDDQAIYGFRGSKPACIQQFVKEYQAKQLLLHINYRSYEEIVAASLSVIGENRERFVKALEASPEHKRRLLPEQASGQKLQVGRAARFREEVVKIYGYESREAQYEALAEKLSALNRPFPAGQAGFAEPSGFTGQERISCAVLFRTNTLMQIFASHLKKRGVPYEMKEKAQSIYEHFVVKDILAYLQYARLDCTGNSNRNNRFGEESPRMLLLRIINKPSRYIEREAVSGEQASLKEVISYYENRLYCEGKLQDNGSVYCHCGRERENMTSRIQCKIAELKRLEKQMQYLKKAPLKASVNYIRKAMGYDRYLKERAGDSQDKLLAWQELLEWLCEDVGGYESVEAWKEAMRREKEKTPEAFAVPHIGTCVQLMTVHASKGLEFDRVYLPDCNENVFPHGHMPDAAACEEERRVFYVAMTRAKRSLRLLFVTGTKERLRLPSRFLNPLWKKYYSSSSTSSSNSQLSRYSSKASATFSYSSSSSIKESSGSSLGSSGFSR